MIHNFVLFRGTGGGTAVGSGVVFPRGTGNALFSSYIPHLLCGPFALFSCNLRAFPLSALGTSACVCVCVDRYYTLIWSL